MLKLIFRIIFVSVLLGNVKPTGVSAQCTTANLNWDNLEYLVTTGSYSGFVTTAMAQTQSFALGTNRLSIGINNLSNFSINGLNTTHTGESGSYGTGADAYFTTSTASARTITLSLDAEVSTFKLSIYDLDGSQKVTVTAIDEVNAPANITLSKPAGGTVTLANNPGASPSGTGNAASYGNNVSTGTLNIDIDGPVKTITLSFSNAAGDFWLSDMSACVTSSFPTNYYSVSQPFTGQPGYVLVVHDNDFYFVNPVNGVGRLLFSDPGFTNMNSLAYDPYNRYVYYTYTLTASPQADKALKRYDVNTGVISTILADVTTLGIPTFENGVEVGGAAFYNGSLYLGIEGVSNRKCIVWRIDFNGSDVPYRACQVYGSDAGASVVHDWGDIAISNGVLYDFDGATGDPDFYHYNLQTGALTNFVPSGIIPGQTSVGWNEQIYNVNGTIAPYNNNGTINSAQQYTITSTPAISAGGRWGDAGEAFRPLLDFGDAPSTYDPVLLSPAVHDQDTLLRLGATYDKEWTKTANDDADGNDDEDGLAYVPILTKSLVNYSAVVSVYNHTGANATVCAWLDYNANGRFDAIEGISVTVPSSASAQNVTLFWPFTPTTIPANSYTYLRIRITSASNGMTTSKPTGYYNNGEVEDYRVLVDNFPLPVKLVSFDAVKTNEQKVKLTWKLNDETMNTRYILQSSDDSKNWVAINEQKATVNQSEARYEYIKEQFSRASWYRLEIIGENGSRSYSIVKKIAFDNSSILIKLIPNPASDHLVASFTADERNRATISVIDIAGKTSYIQSIQIEKGANSIPIPLGQSFPSGTYILQLRTSDKQYTERFIIKK